MSYRKQLWMLYNDIIQPEVEKIVCPITGGLDSRLLAYILKLKGAKLVSYFLTSPKVNHNRNYAQKIADLCDSKHFVFQGSFSSPHSWVLFDGAKLLSRHYNLKEYDFYIPACNEIATGFSFNKENRRNFWLNDPELKYTSSKSVPKSPYRKIVDPTYNPRLVGFIHNLPLRQRIFQKCYIEMLQEYTPLGDIPRCNDRPYFKPMSIHKGQLNYIYNIIKLRRAFNGR